MQQCGIAAHASEKIKYCIAITISNFELQGVTMPLMQSKFVPWKERLEDCCYLDETFSKLLPLER
jgi:hypothetical protein